MRRTLSDTQLAAYVSSQLNTFFPDGSPVSSAILGEHIPAALRRLETCFQKIRRKYFFEDGETVFDHLHGDHYAMFLYLLSNTMHRADGDERICTKIFLLNKALHGIDAYFSVKLPNIFLFIHPVGTVLGNAEYSDYFVVYQNCGIGADETGLYPRFGEGVIMYARSSVLGESEIGHDVVIGADSFIINTQVPAHSVVVGKFPHHRVIPNSRTVMDRAFRQR